MTEKEFKLTLILMGAVSIPIWHFKWIMEIKGRRVGVSKNGALLVGSGILNGTPQPTSFEGALTLIKNYLQENPNAETWAHK